MPSPAYSILYSASVAPTASSGGAGDVLIPISSGGLYVLATSANRGTRRSTGIALSPYAANGVVDIQQEGYVDATTSGLGTGTASLVRVSATGSLERIASPGASDDVVGWCETDGSLHLRCGQSPGGYGYGAAGFTAPTGTGVVTVTGGSLDAAATAFPLAANKVVQATGTGIPHVVAGALSAASSLIVDADVSASAAIAVSKLAPSGTNGWFLTTTAGVPVWAAVSGGSGSPGGSTTQVQYNSAGAFAGDVGMTYDAAGKLSLSAALAIGATPAGIGLLRVPYSASATVLGVKDSTAADRDFLSQPSADMLRFGNLGGHNTEIYGFQVNLVAGSGNLIDSSVSGAYSLSWSSTQVRAAQPIVGDARNSAPYSVHGAVTYAFAANANYTLTSAEYIYDWINFSPGAWTVGRTVTFPNPATLAASYTKTIVNNTGFTLTVSNGGTTKTLAVGLAQRFLFGVSAVSFASATWTP